MRTAIYAKLVRLSFGFYDRHQTGQLMSRATVDLQGVRFFLGYGLIFFFQHVFTIVGVGIVVFVLSWKLALVTLAIGAGAGRRRLPLQPRLASRCCATSSRRWPTSRPSPRRTSSASTWSSRSPARTPSRRSSRSAARRVFGQSVKANRQRAFYIPILSFLPLLAQAAILLFGGQMVVRGTLSLDDFVAFNLYLAMLDRPAAGARHVDRPGAACDRLGRADLPGDRRAGGDPRRARRRRAAGRAGTDRLRRRHLRL